MDLLKKKCPLIQYYSTVDIIYGCNGGIRVQGKDLHIGWGNLYIVDISEVPKYCVCGDHLNQVELFSDKQTGEIIATYDGITMLPIKSLALNLNSFLRMDHYSEWGFGTFLIGRAEVYNKKYIMLYNPYKFISCVDNKIIDTSVFNIDGEIVVCCITNDYKCVAINMDGVVLDMESLYCEPHIGYYDITFKTKYGKLRNLISSGVPKRRQSWAFGGAVIKQPISGSKTKPASREIDYS